MADQNILLQQSNSITTITLSPQEEALQSLCKQLLKSRFFCGYYEERRFVDAVNNYRDIIGLHRSERELERLLLDIKCKLQLFYLNSPQVWIGITHGTSMGVAVKKYTLDIYIWVELSEVAFGQYWFNVKSVRFRNNEVILKLKVVRVVEESRIERLSQPRIATSVLKNSCDETKPALAKDEITPQSHLREMVNASNQLDPEVTQIGYEDFVNVVRDWGVNIKHSVYDFMSNDINKDNIKGLLQFLGLFVVTLLTFSVAAINYLGTFALCFMFEFTRFTHVMTPIILKILDIVNKMLGGVYILVAMIWKDIFYKRKISQESQLPNLNENPRNLKAIEYNRPSYKSIEYNIRHSPLQPPLMRPNRGPFTEFERKFQ